MTDSTGYKEHLDRLRGLSYPVGVYRPPSEGGSFSLLLRITKNCPWNRCTFCNMYKGHTFVYRSVADIKADIDTVRVMQEEITAISRKLGFGGMVTREVARAILRTDPPVDRDHSFAGMFNWLSSGGKTAFLQDANSLIMRPAEFVEVLRYLREQLPSLERVTSYARSKTLAQRKPKELQAIREAGLDRIHVGLETGDDEVLQIIKKGVTSDEQIAGGRKAVEAGFQLSLYWMTDLGGRRRWLQHAENTARVLSAIDPHYIRSRPLVPRRGTPLFSEYEAGNLILSSPHERLEDLEVMIGNLDVTSRVCFDHAMNSWTDGRGQLLFTQDYEGYQFPDEKEFVLERIRRGLSVDESNHVSVEELIAMGTF